MAQIEATFVQGNTGPDITAQLHDEADATQLIDLTGATVRFQMRKHDDQLFTVDADADVVGDPTQGNVSYSWGANDLAVPGEYEAQWETTFPDGKVITTAQPNVIFVRRR